MNRHDSGFLVAFEEEGRGMVVTLCASVDGVEPIGVKAIYRGVQPSELDSQTLLSGLVASFAARDGILVSDRPVTVIARENGIEVNDVQDDSQLRDDHAQLAASRVVDSRHVQVL